MLTRMSWPWAGRRLRLSLRLLSRAVCALEQQTVTQMEAQAQLCRIADALEDWNGAPAAEDAYGLGLGGVEQPVPTLDAVLQRMSLSASAAVVNNPRSFRTAPPAREAQAQAQAEPGGVSYRDPALLVLAAQVEAGLTQALGRAPTEQELDEALAIAEGRQP